jgi:phage-related protein
MKAIFTWIPVKASLQERPRILSSKFGDGYEQRRAEGINHIAQHWSLFFVCHHAAMAHAILGFLRAHKGSEIFYWTPPDVSTAIHVICREYSSNIEPGNSRTISATFEQVFG